MRFRTIVVPTDRAERSGCEVRVAADLARAFGARVCLLECAPAGPAGDEGAGTRFARSGPGDFDAWLRAGVGPAALEGVDWEGVAGWASDVGTGIADAAAGLHADLVVMRSRRGPAPPALLGTAAETVCRCAPCSVLVVRPDEQGGAPGPPPFRRILVAYDYSTDSELALKEGLALAEAQGSELHLLHVVAAGGREAPDASARGADVHCDYAEALGRLALALPEDSARPCRVVRAVRWGRPYRAILEYAEENRIDLICMGVRGAGFGSRALFGSNVDRVLRQSPCPTLIARPLRPSLEAPPLAAGAATRGAA